MEFVDTKYFGKLPLEAQSVFSFLEGIPGFEEHHAFVFLDRQDAHPLVFMQSVSERDVCFVAVPVLVADPNYRIELSGDEQTALDLPPDCPPALGQNIACLALITTGGEAGPTVNLASPIFLNLSLRRGIQAIRTESGYPMRKPLLPQLETQPCS